MKKKILRMCKGILDRFDEIEYNTIERGERNFDELETFWKEEAGEDKFLKECCGVGKEDNLPYGYVVFCANLVSLAFGFGYCLGQLIDSTDPEDQKDISMIQGIIREKHLLPYLPREKKAA
jgi:hypothetical protein